MFWQISQRSVHVLLLCLIVMLKEETDTNEGLRCFYMIDKKCTQECIKLQESLHMYCINQYIIL